MKIYAIRDRLIDYFQQPFVGPNDNAVKASLSNHISNPEATDAIAQAPHHFEIWELGEVHEDGHIEPSQKLVCDCSSLIRPSVRTGRAGEPRSGTDSSPDRGEQRTAQEAPGDPRAVERAPTAAL